jgi:hypothetical protein
MTCRVARSFPNQTVDSSEKGGRPLSDFASPAFRKEVQNYLRACEYRKSVLKSSTPTSPSLSQEERERVAAEALLKIGDLTDAEMEAVQDMLNRLSDKRVNSQNDGQP